MAKKAKMRGSYTDARRQNKFQVRNMVPFQDEKAHRFLETVAPVLTGWRLIGMQEFIIAKGDEGICMSIHNTSDTKWLSVFLDEPAFEAAVKIGYKGATPQILDFDKTMETVFKLIMTAELDGVEMSMSRDGEQVVSTLIPITNEGYRRWQAVMLDNKKRREAEKAKKKTEAPTE